MPKMKKILGLKATGRTDQQIGAIRRFFHGMEVVEAKDNLRVFVAPQDIRKAKKKDPAHCVYANACRRLYGSHAILFFRSIAYVDLPNDEGKRIVNRFVLRREVKKQIVRFDKTGKTVPGGFLLSAPSRTETIAGRNKISSAYYRRRASGAPISKPHRKAYLKGRMVMAAMGTDIRNGTGMVHFIK